jgi:hypothetical protein
MITTFTSFKIKGKYNKEADEVYLSTLFAAMKIKASTCAHREEEYH